MRSVADSRSWVSDSDAPCCETWRRSSHPTPFFDGIASWLRGSGPMLGAAQAAPGCSQRFGAWWSGWRWRIRRGGYTRIQGALKNMGHRVARSTIATILKVEGLPPSGEWPTSWRTFLRAHWPALVAADFFTTSMKGSLESRDTSSERSASGLSSHPDARRDRVSTTLGRLSSHAPGA